MLSNRSLLFVGVTEHSVEGNKMTLVHMLSVKALENFFMDFLS